jgi:hypothetical protein
VKQRSSHFRQVFATPITLEGFKWVDELEGTFGIPDYVVVRESKERVLYVVAFELKLRNWRQGLIQAFRYKNFSNEAFLVLDHAHITAASENLAQFVRSNVGLASYNRDGEFHVHWAPRPSVPFSNDFSERAVRKFYERTTTSDFSQFDSIPSLAFSRTARGSGYFQKAIRQINQGGHGSIVFPIQGL